MTYHGRPRGYINLKEVLPFIPGKRCREESRTFVDVSVSSKLLAISADHDSICTFLFDSDTIVGEAALWVPVEDPQETGALEHNDFVTLVLEADVGLWGV